MSLSPRPRCCRCTRPPCSCAGSRRPGGGGGVISQLDSNPSGTVVTEYHSDNAFKNLVADFLSSGSNDGNASLRITGLNGHTTTYTVTCVRQVY